MMNDWLGHLEHNILRHWSRAGSKQALLHGMVPSGMAINEQNGGAHPSGSSGRSHLLFNNLQHLRASFSCDGGEGDDVFAESEPCKRGARGLQVVGHLAARELGGCCQDNYERNLVI